MSNINNNLQISTTPGGSNWSSPPRGTTRYQEWLVDILSRSQLHAQGFGLLESFYRRCGFDPSYPEQKPVIEGPFKDDLTAALTTQFASIVARSKEMRAIREAAEHELKKQQDKEESATQKAAKKTRAKKSGPTTDVAVKGMTISDMAKERNAAFLDSLKASLS